MRHRAGRPADRGFILVDALMAAMLAGAAGTVIYAIGAELLQRQDELLDRTVAVTTIHMLAKQLLVTGTVPEGTADEAFTYEVKPVADSRSGSAPLFLITATASRGSWTTSVTITGYAQ
jgi:hypothetical protein